jgi:hypothetical protein
VPALLAFKDLVGGAHVATACLWCTAWQRVWRVDCAPCLDCVASCAACLRCLPAYGILCMHELLHNCSLMRYVRICLPPAQVMLFHKFQPIKPVQALARELLTIIRQQPGLAQEQQEQQGGGTGGGAAAGGEHDSDYVMVGQQDSGASPAAAGAQQGSTGVGPAVCRSQFAFLLGRFVKACGAGSFAAVADHLLTVAATAPIDQCAACRPGWWFNSVANGVNPEDGRSGFRQAGEGGPLVQELSQGGVGQKRKASEGDEVSSSSMHGGGASS